MSTDGLPTDHERALSCIRQHGGSAGYFAATMADKFLDLGEREAAATWRRILAEIERLQEARPEGGVN